MLEEEAVEVVKQFDLLADYREAVLFVLNYVQTNKHLLCCAYDSMGREEMKLLFLTRISSASPKASSADTERQWGSTQRSSSRNFSLIFIPKPSPVC